jgi:hypothetical protein
VLPRRAHEMVCTLSRGPIRVWGTESAVFDSDLDHGKTVRKLQGFDQPSLLLGKDGIRREGKGGGGGQRSPVGRLYAGQMVCFRKVHQRCRILPSSAGF